MTKPPPDRSRDFVPPKDSIKNRPRINASIREKILKGLKKNEGELKETKKIDLKATGKTGQISQSGFCPKCNSTNVLSFTRLHKGNRSYKCMACSASFISPTTYGECEIKGVIFKDTVLNYCMDLCDIPKKEGINIHAVGGCPHFGTRTYSQIRTSKIEAVDEINKKIIKTRGVSL